MEVGTTDQVYISDGLTYQDVLSEEFKKNNKDVIVCGIDGQSTFGHKKTSNGGLKIYQN